MTCTRCEGLMVTDDLIDLQESYHPMRLSGHRCLSCGNVVDTLIPVSYTHLDVYKRQVWNRRSSCRNTRAGVMPARNAESLLRASY